MARIIESGTGRNLTSNVVQDRPVPDPTEKKFVTFTNDLGAVHTIIVDVEHAAKDADELLRWFDHTRTSVEHRTHLTPAEVFQAADEFIGAGAKKTDPTDSHESSTETGGGY